MVQFKSVYWLCLGLTVALGSTTNTPVRSTVGRSQINTKRLGHSNQKLMRQRQKSVEKNGSRNRNGGLNKLAAMANQAEMQCELDDSAHFAGKTQKRMSDPHNVGDADVNYDDIIADLHRLLFKEHEDKLELIQTVNMLLKDLSDERKRSKEEFAKVKRENENEIRHLQKQIQDEVEESDTIRAEMKAELMRVFHEKETLQSRLCESEAKNAELEAMVAAAETETQERSRQLTEQTERLKNEMNEKEVRHWQETQQLKQQSFLHQIALQRSEQDKWAELSSLHPIPVPPPVLPAMPHFNQGPPLFAVNAAVHPAIPLHPAMLHPRPLY